MNIRKIIKEALINEVGSATSQPYKWYLKKSDERSATYWFRTKGGSNLLIEANFFLTSPDAFETLGILDEFEHPYFYWDTEFVVLKDEKEDIPDYNKNMTISSSDYKSKNFELFRIMSTLSSIVKDFISIHKVRGFVFKPASSSRGNLFTKYFQQQLPNAEIKVLNDEITIVTINDSIRYTEGDGSYYDNEEPYQGDNQPGSKLRSGKEDDWYYDWENRTWRRNNFIGNTKRKLNIK